MIPPVRAFIRRCKHRKREFKIADSTTGEMKGADVLIRALILRRLLKRHVLGQHSAGLDVHVTGERADGDVVAGVADVRQVGDATDVDERARLGEPQLHEWQQAVAAGEELGIVTVLADEADRFGGRPGPDVIELCGDHLAAPFMPAAHASTDCTML